MVYNLTCQDDVVRPTSPGENYANIFWLEPTLDPNSSDVTVAQVGDAKQNGDRFPIGKTTIVYQATDKNGEFVANCSIDMNVFGKIRYMYIFSSNFHSSCSAFGIFKINDP